MSRQYGALSGVAIVLVVVNHSVHFGLQVSPVEGAWLKLLSLLQALGSFAVPAFLFVSGAFLSYAARELSFGFVRASLGRILWPYVIWSTLFYGLVSLTNEVRPSIAVYIKNLLVGYPYHFVPILIFWYVTAPIVVRVGKRHGALLLVAIGLYQTFLLALRWSDMVGAPGPLPDWMHALQPAVLSTSMCEWAIYFPLGLVLSQHAAALTPWLLGVRWLAVGATVGLFVLGILNAFEVMWAPWARFAAPVPLMFLLPVVERGWIPFVRGFEVVGRRSYGIYLAHLVVINLVVLLASWPRLNLDSRPLVVFPTFLVAALGASLLLMNVMTRTLPARSVYRLVFGIMPPVARIRGRRSGSGDVPMVAGNG